MKEITREAIRKFLKAESFSKSNTSVKVLPNVTVLSLFGNEIAYLYNDPDRTLSITNAGWVSKTTKERLNGLPNVNIRQQKGIFYLNGEKWNGKLKDVLKLSEYKNIYLTKMKKNGEARKDIEKYLKLKNMTTEEFLDNVVFI